MRKWLLAGFSVGVLGVLAALLSGSRTEAAKGDGKAPEETPRSVQLPVTRVVLFSSGVGHFLREGRVQDDARIDLSFPVADVNDLIKSMVVRDMDGGHITAVSYDSSAPIERTLKSFAVNLTSNPSFEQILNQARGERAEVTLASAAPGAPGMSGTIVGVEKQKVPAGKDTVDVAVLNLWCSDGVRAVKLNEVARVRFLSPTLESEFKKALETLALSHDTQKKAVAVRCQGEGNRRVQVGYVVENPIWKTSYRLVLGAKNDKKAPYLQGWSVVENSTDEDWKDVRMALVSGRPISFQMDLYSPLFVNRPSVQLELFASLRPVAYSGSLEEGERLMADAKERAIQKQNESRRLAYKDKGKGKADRDFDDAAPAAPDKKSAGGAEYAKRLRDELKEPLDLGGSVSSAATASKLGDFFQYAIDKPVSLPRQKSALLPIVGKDVEATRTSIYNERVQAKFPLLGLRFKNTSGLHLMQGPITIFEGGTYAGDAVIRDLQPNEERLLSYAVDLGTEVNPVPSTENGRYLTLKAVKGVVHATSKVRQIKTYTVKNRNDEERLVLIEHPVNNAFKVVGDKPRETASDFHRFELRVPAGETKSKVVTEERDEFHRWEFNSSNDDTVRMLMTQPVTSPKLKAALEQAMKLRWASNGSATTLGDLRRQLKVIEDDQARLRANLDKTPSTAAVYKKYLKKLDDQEEQIEKLQEKIEAQEKTALAQKRAYDDFLANLTAE
jgi:hypothetical protein